MNLTLADFIVDNAISMIAISITVLGGLIAWLTALKGDLVELKSDMKYLRQITETLGNASQVRNEVTNGRLQAVEDRVNGLSLTFAEWRGTTSHQT